MADDFTGDFSDITQQPQQQLPEKKPYWQVLDDYDRARSQEPDIAKMSVSDFARNMNQVTGSNTYDEGLNDSFMRRLATAPERGFRHFGGTLPGETEPFGKSLSEMLGGPREGWDLPAAAHTGAADLSKSMGMSPGLSEAVGTGAEGLVKTVPAVLASMAAPEAAPFIFGGQAATETYGETGRLLPTAISGTIGALTPKILESGGQAALKAVGAKTIGETLDPEITALARNNAQTSDLLSKYTPEAGWGPTSLVQRGARIAGAQTGFFAAGEAGQAAQTLTDPNLTWQQKLEAIGGQFKPSNLVSSAVSQTPFLPFDLFSERTHPLKQVEGAIKTDFANRYTAAALQGDPESGSPPFVPTQDDINRAMENVGKGKPTPQESTVLKSMGELPLEPEREPRPIVTSETAVPIDQAMAQTRTRVNAMLVATGVPRNVNTGYDQTIYTALRSAEIKGEGKASWDDIQTDAASIVSNKIRDDVKGLGFMGESPEDRWSSQYGAWGDEMADYNRHMKEITEAITPGTPGYDQEAHQRVALATGDPEHWLEAGITEPVMYNANAGPTEQVSTTIGGGEPIEVTRRGTVPTRLRTNLVDRMSGMGPKPTLDPEILGLQERLRQLKAQIEAPVAPENVGELAQQYTALQKELDTAQSKLDFRKRGFATGTLTGGKPDVQGAIWGDTSFAALKRAFNYGRSDSDKEAGRVLDLKDPASVAKFINNVTRAMKVAEADAGRIRGPEKRLDVYNTEAQAQEAIPALEAAKADDPNTAYRYRVRNLKDGRFQIVESSSPKVRSLGEPDLAPDAAEQQIEALYEQRGVQTLADLGKNVDELADNKVANRFRQIGKQYSDQAEVEARRKALADNFTYFLQHMPDSEFEKIILTAPNAADQKSIQKPAELKKRMMRYLQFMRDGGYVDVSKTAPEGGAVAEQFLRGGVGTTEGVEVPIPGRAEGPIRHRMEEGPITMPEGAAIPQFGPGGRLRGGPREQLLKLNDYMNLYGMGEPNYPATHARAGQPRVDNWNNSQKAGLNFFEQFAALAKEFEKQVPFYEAYGDSIEQLPLGDFGGVPRGFKDEILNNLRVAWSPELEKGRLILPRGGFPEGATGPGEVVMNTFDRQGNPVKLSNDVGKATEEEGAQFVNPLRVFFRESAKRDLTMPLNNLLGLFRQYGGLDENSQAMLQIAQKLAGASAFVRDTPVGIGIAKDDADKAYTHLGTMFDNAGVLLSPFRIPADMRGKGFRTVRELMTPAEIFPHFMNEIGHLSVDFAYMKDAGFKAEVDQIYNYVKEHVENMKVMSAGTYEFSQTPLHALTNPREFIASIFNDNRLHKLLQSLEDPFTPLEPQPVTGTAAGNLWTRLVSSIRSMLTRLFGIGMDESNTLLNRMTELASRGFDLQSEMNLRHRGDVYLEAEASRPGASLGLIETGRRPFRELKVGGEGAPVFPRAGPPVEPVNVEYLRQQVEIAKGHLAENPNDTTKANYRNAEAQLVAALKEGGLEERPYTWQIRNHEQRLAEARKLLDESAYLPTAAQRAREQVVREEQILRALREKQANESGVLLTSRTVPNQDEGPTIPKPVFNIAGRKGTLLRDPVINSLVTNFVAGRNVQDAFSGSGQLSHFAKTAGADNVSMNVFRPDMYGIFNEIKSNPNGFGRRVANVVRQIDSQRKTVPKMRDGSDIRQYLDQVQQRDPNVGLFVKQNLSYFGKEVGPESFTPAAVITNQGLSELPNRIRRFASSVDRLTNGNGWDVVGNAQSGDRVLVDPPYATGTGRYGTAGVSPEQRVADYERYMYPAAQRGAKFMVFDAADPRLVQSLMDHGFTVQPVQRSGRTGAEVKQEIVAFNHNGNMLPSRTDEQSVLDSMKSGALYMHESPSRLWFRPYDHQYFRDTYAPMLGDNLQLERRGPEAGYSVSKNALRGLTPDDLAQMPQPKVERWAPSLYETLNSLYRNQGSSPETANALAVNMMRQAALLRDSDKAVWGAMKDEDTKEGFILGQTWGWPGIIGLTPQATKSVYPLESTIRHESTHAALERNVFAMPPDVRFAYDTVNNVFNTLDEGGRRAMLEGLQNMTHWDAERPGVYEAALQNPREFGAEFMAHIGDMITNVPKPSVYLREQMRFLPDEMSRLVTLHTLRQTQGVDKLVQAVQLESSRRGTKDPGFEGMVRTMSNAFNKLARPALDISNDIAEAYRMRNLYPDMYKGLLAQTAQRMETYAQGELLATNPPMIESDILKSRESIEKTVRKWFRLPDSSGQLPDKLSFWDKELTNFSQFADKYPIARSAWDMFYNGKAIFNTYRTKIATALAGAFEGKGLVDDARTKHVAEFVKRDDLRKAFSGLALELNAYGDHLFQEELVDANGDIMAMNPQKVTGWLTPEWIKGAMTKYDIADKDVPTMMTVLDGTRNQIKMTSATIVASAMHRMDSAIAIAVARNSDLPPEASRQTAKLLSDSIKLQSSNPVAAQDKLNQFMNTVNNPEAAERMYDAATGAWDGIRTLARFLELRMPYFMSERRPGQFGLFFKDAKDKVTSRYFKNDAERSKYITGNNIDPVRLTNPGDKDYGVSPQVFKQLDDVQSRMQEKLVNLFGQDEGQKLAAVMDMASDLRDALNSRDVLKATTGRDLAPGREELDMFSAHQQYINAIGRASYNNFLRLETELLNTSVDFDTQPAIKDYINRQVKMVLLPDSQIGRQAQNLGFLYYLFANPSSMIMQSTHQILGLAPMLTQRGASIAQSFNIIRKANQLLIEARTKGKYADPVIQEMVDRANRDGSLGSWLQGEMDYGQDQSLINRMRATVGKPLWTPFDMLKNRTYQGFDFLRRLYDMVPRYNSEVALVASLLHLRSKAGGSMAGEGLYREAQFLRSITMFTGGKENRPGFFQVLPRSAAQMIWNLQTYANGLTTMMGELIRRSINPKGMTPAQTKQTRYAAAQMLITQTAVAGVLGMPFAQAVLYGLQKLFPEHNIENDVREGLAGLFGDDEQMGNLFSSVVTAGVPSSMDYSPDLGARFALAGTFHVSPYSGVGWEQLVGPTGGIASRALDALQSGIRGDPLGSVQDLMPTGMQRVWKALEQGHNYQTESGQMVVSDLRPEEIVARAIGFRPSRVARIEDFERLSRVSEDAEKAQQTRWVKEQVKLMGSGQDAQVQQNITKREAESKGLYPAVRLSSDISREYERETMPANLRAYGNRATILSQRSLRGVLGTQSEGPSNFERLQLQQTIANRLGLGGPSRSSLRHAGQVDQLLDLYPHLTNAQANLLLTHAVRSRPTPELYSELTEE